MWGRAGTWRGAAEGGHWPMAYAKKRAIRKIALSECKATKKIENNKKEPIKIEREIKKFRQRQRERNTATNTEKHAHTHMCCIHEMGISKRKIEN